ncbi:iron(III) transport system permease protein [Neorhizobium galegae]|uniref:ABC transporter permease n=1 Tax=Neorhizobium galegae TaxID=399 RepID=UPI00277F7CD2|nr:ABC transporter permease subunit [Neorhizobium galegae]MDQ0137678.1 iron(III) transport system permease protein [Neorhizobium galegae]
MNKAKSAPVWRRRLPAVIAALTVIYFFLVPFVMLVVGAFRTSPYGADKAWTSAGVRTVLSDAGTLNAVLSSIIYAGLVTAIAISIGLYFATIATRFRGGLVMLILPIMMILAATPRLFYALAWGMVGNPNSGLIGAALRSVGLAQIATSFNVYSWAGMVLVTALKVGGLAFFLLYGAVRATDRGLEDAAVISGSNRTGAFFRITLPLLTPAIVAVAILLFIEGVQVFDYPAVLGAPAGVNTLSLRVSDYLLKSMEPDWSAAGALSLLSVILVGVMLYLQRHLTGGGKQFTTVGGKAAPGSLSDADPASWWASASVAIFFVIAIALPITQIVWGSFQSYFGVYGSFSLVHYETLLADGETIRTLATTLGIAIFGGFLTVSIAFAMALVMARHGHGWLGWLIRVASWIPATAPGIVLSLAFVWSYLYTPIVNRLYGTPWLMLSALVIASTPIAVRAAEGMIAQIGPELEEAARLSGANVWQSAVHVTARLCLPGLMAAWFLVSLAISGMLDVPLLLQTTGSQTVATQAYSLFSSGQISQAAALYNLFILLVVVIASAAALTVSIVRRAALRTAHVIPQADLSLRSPT